MESPATPIIPIFFWILTSPSPSPDSSLTNYCCQWTLDIYKLMQTNFEHNSLAGIPVSFNVLSKMFHLIL